MNWNFKLSKNIPKIRICHNKSNKLWKPIGLSYNIPQIKIDNKWYCCSLTVCEENKEITISHIHELDGTKIIKEIEGVYNIKLTNIKIQTIKILLNQHKLNKKLFKIKKNIYERRNTIFIFMLGFLLSLVYYIINTAFNNVIINFISDSLWCQTILMFLTFSSFINIFFPFTIRKEISQKDVEKTSKEKAKETLDKIKKDEEIKKRATF